MILQWNGMEMPRRIIRLCSSSLIVTIFMLMMSHNEILKNLFSSISNSSNCAN